MSVDDTIKAVTESYDYILAYTPDIHGILRSKTYPIRHAHLFKEHIPVVNIFTFFGIQNEIIVIPRCQEEKFGNCFMKPELSTHHPLPWFGEKKGARFGGIFCDGYWTKDEVMSSNTRNMARKQLELLDAEGYQLLTGYEYEFRLYKGEPNCHVKDLLPANSDKQMFHSTMINKYQDYIIDLDRSLQKIGVDIEYLTTEYGSGMLEMPHRPQYGLKASDNAAIFKDGVRQVALNNGYRATFMTKPIPGETGNGCHFNHSVWSKSEKGAKSATNAFYDPKKEHNLSEFAMHWIGGLVEHSHALTALCSPTVNCFRRLHTPWAPSEAYWQLEDRTATFRVKTNSESACYIENRLGTAAANPYLLLAGTVAAGLDGVKRKLNPPSAGDKVRGALPKTLTEALDALNKDTIMVEALGKEFVDIFTQIKKDSEMTFLAGIDITKDNPKDYALEFEQYFDYV